MKITLDGEMVSLVNIDCNDFEVKISYIDSQNKIKVKQKKVGLERVLTIATNVVF